MSEMIVANEKPMSSVGKFRISVLGLREDNIEDCGLRDFGKGIQPSTLLATACRDELGKQTASVLKQKKEQNAGLLITCQKTDSKTISAV